VGEKWSEAITESRGVSGKFHEVGEKWSEAITESRRWAESFMK
jgi:hypothetical protein